MTAAKPDHLSFSIGRQQLQKNLLIPKYYDPELHEANELASADFYLPRLGDLLFPGPTGSRLGSWIRREHYGTGQIPYVRTSDLNGWRLRPDYKKGVARQVFDKVAKVQDVQIGDILMVAHGTYLVGTVAIVTAQDMPLVLQDHVFRLRISPSSKFTTETGIKVDPWLVLAALSTRFVKRQIRARQFSADIIDKIGERHLDVRVPIPRSPDSRERISSKVQNIIEKQSEARHLIGEILGSDMRMIRERSETRLGFTIERRSLARNVLVPKYYDPQMRSDIDRASRESDTPWLSIGELVDRNLITVTTGVEVGKMAYGTGDIPFLRTTDIAELEVKANPRQGISKESFEAYAAKASVNEGDILLVRDGTYLVGSSAIVTKDDLPAIICGGLYRIRVSPGAAVEPYALLGSLNLPLVRRQMRSKQFTRDVIDTLGKRLFEVRIPDPRSEHSIRLAEALGRQMRIKEQTRKELGSITSQVEPAVPVQSRNRPGWSMRG
ncbi:hypothetical protein GOA66_21475 [Sinorhizobium meliloti]|nr:hypothetical protein [Sinorhizobium meliloti]